MSSTPLPDPEVLASWRLSVGEVLGSRSGYQWLVNRGDDLLVLRRYPEGSVDIDYELEVLFELRNQDWPVPEVVEPPISDSGVTWCVFSFLPGNPPTGSDDAERESRGRILARLHATLASTDRSGQRSGHVRTDAVIADPELLEALAAYEQIRPDAARLMRWHLDHARERLEGLDIENAPQHAIHGDFAPWNLLFDGTELSGIVDFEHTHRDFRIAEFALAWRGRYDAVVRGYEWHAPLSDLEKDMLVPIHWAWLLRGVKEEAQDIVAGRRPDHGFAWQAKQLLRRSPLFGELAEPYRT